MSRSSTDSPLESISVAPSVSIPARSSWPSTARTAPLKLCGRFTLAATSRPIDSAITLSELFIISRSRSISGGDCTEATSLAPATGDRRKVTDCAGSTANAAARARPASSAGVVERRESTLTGWVRPPSSITDSIGAMSPF